MITWNFFMVALGFEPRLEDSKSSVLTATLCDRFYIFYNTSFLDHISIRDFLDRVYLPEVIQSIICTRIFIYTIL